MRKLIFALVLGLLLPAQGFSLGLGDIQVNSKLNQKLGAQIDLISVTPEDADILIIKLASREEFTKAGLDRPHSLTELKFKALVKNGNVYIDVKSAKIIREPSLSFLIEVDWPKGHLVREYTILFEPPATMGRK